MILVQKLSIFVFFLGILFAKETYADVRFPGDFLELSARGGASANSDDEYSGLLLDVGLRYTFLMYIPDIRVALRHERFTKDSPNDPKPDNLSLFGTEITLGIHPTVFLNGVSYFYGEVGIGAHYATSDDGDDDFGMSYSFGVGVDIPVVQNSKKDWSIWINALYRYRLLDFDSVSGSEINLNAHSVFLGLGFRWNSILMNSINGTKIHK